MVIIIRTVAWAGKFYQLLPDKENTVLAYNTRTAKLLSPFQLVMVNSLIIGFANKRNLQAVAGGSGENLTCFVEYVGVHGEGTMELWEKYYKQKGTL